MCLSEKLAIIKNREHNLLNQRSELMHRCIHKKAQYPLVGEGEVTSAAPGVTGRKSKSGREWQQESAIDTSRKNREREHGETIVTGGNSYFYILPRMSLSWTKIDRLTWS